MEEETQISRRTSWKATNKIGGVYSADGHIVVQEGKSNYGHPRGAKGNHGVFDHFLHHHHNHKNKNQKRGGGQTGSSAGSSNGKGNGGLADNGPPWEKRVDSRNSTYSRKIDLIPRAKLRQRSPDYRGLPPPDRPIKHSVSCCGNRPKPEIERTWSDTGHYARPRPIYCEEKGNGIEKRYVKYEKNFSPEPEKHGYCTLKRVDPRLLEIVRSREESDMDYYTATSSEGGSHDNTIKYANLLERAEVHREQTPKNTLSKEVSSKKSSVSDATESQESGFDERRDSASSQELIEKSSESIYSKLEQEIRAKTILKETKEDIETAAAEVMRELTETIVEGNHQIHKEEEEKEAVKDKENNKKIEILAQSNNESVTLMTNHRLSRKELNDQINKFIGKRGNSTSALYESTPNITETNGERTFVEEEYSYEPELKRSSSKLVMRTRSLLNLDEENKHAHHHPKLIRPTAARTKITTGPDGTFVIAGRKASSELNLSDESNSNSSSTSPKIERFLSGEELRKRKEEIFRNINAPQPPKDTNKYNEEINKDNSQSTKETAINNLKNYLKENKIGLRELLTNKNVVIIEPYRTEKELKDASEYNHRNAEFDKGCRITSATAKNGMEITCIEPANNNTLPRASKPHQPTVQRHYFYHLVKPKDDPREEDLPDPDQVKSTREKFQKEGKIRGPQDKEIMLPIAAKIVSPYKSNQSKPRLTPEVRVIYDPRQRASPDIKKNNNNKKWTDTGSLSSGVSSDMSCFENELDNNLEEISHKGYSSDDEEEAETCTKEPEIHPVSPEVMQKIRACGTTVTYYGGRVISHSHGPIRSPMTMTIMDEIRQGSEASRARKGSNAGFKFRLIKSNSCGSRLELAGTEDAPSEISKNRFYEDMYGKSLGDELAESRSKMETMEEVEEVDERANNYTRVQEEFEKKFGNDQKQPVQSWRALIESRKQDKARNLRRSHLDMEFEEFQVADS